jgi:hypothetical protein
MDSNTSELTLLNSRPSPPASVHSSRAPSPQPQGPGGLSPRTLHTPSSVSAPPFPSKPRPGKPKTFKQRPCAFISQLHAFVDSWWCLEISAGFLAVIAMLLISGVLLKTKNTPLSHWTWSISPNTFVSIFDTTATVTMVFCASTVIEQSKWIFFEQKARPLSKLELFNEGSRGSWGALKFIVGVNRRAVVACASAIVVALQLAMDPFAQSVISFSPGITLITPNASFPVSQIYDPDIGQCAGSATYCEPQHDNCFPHCRKGTDLTIVSYNLMPDIQAAVVTGMYGSISPPAFSCPSANCTWKSATASLAVSSNCRDVSNITKRQSLPSSNDEVIGYSYTTPSGLDLATWQTVPNSQKPYCTTVNSSGLAIDAFDPGYNESQIASFATLKFNSSSDCLKNVSPEITECTFSWVAEINENAALNSNIFTFGPSHQLPLMFQNYTSKGISGNTTELVVSTNGSPYNEHLFYISTEQKDDMGRFLADVFTGWWETDDSEAIRNSVDSFGMFPRILHAGDVMQIAGNVSTSFTNALRQSPNGTTNVGQAWIMETYIRVNWAYLSLPATLVLLSIVTLVWTIVANRRHKTQLWKSNSLAVLFHQLEGWEDNELKVTNKEELEKRAKDLARLGPSESGLMSFVRA